MVKTEHFDAIIVGSGFGGSVMAYRLAEAGLSVCVLERGKAYPPGAFPRDPHQMKNNFWDPSEGYHGLFNIWSFDNLEAVVSSGLGGGSLIYANVLIRKDEKWFVREDNTKSGYEYWAINRAELDPHYDRVEQMLKPQTYPLEFEPYSQTSKTQALRYAAQQLKLDWYLPPLAVTFGNVGEPPVPGEPIKEEANLHGRTRSTCRLCGECDIGCNYGSKNSLDYNYLSHAQKRGAGIRPLHEVKAFEPYGQGYRVHYVIHTPKEEYEGIQRNTEAMPQHAMTCKYLVLAAGTLGSTYLLLKNRSAFPQLSPKIGMQFCGNGDLLTLALNCSDNLTGARQPRPINSAFGPVITSTIRVPDTVDGGDGRGFYIQDAGYPGFVNWMLQMTDILGMVSRLTSFVVHRVGQRLSGVLDTDVSDEIARLFGKVDFSATMMPLLGMGRDVPDGKMSLNRQGKLLVDWNMHTSEVYFQRLREQMRQVAAALGSEPFMDNPLWYLSRLITVHPLGGCPIGRNPHEGVVDSYGQVFNYPGLYVADGAVMPGPTGANPSLTIAALADRFADGIIREQRAEGREQLL